jgi:hypothetical protein
MFVNLVDNFVPALITASISLLLTKPYNMTEEEAAEAIQAIREFGLKLRTDKEFARQFFKDAGIVFPNKKKNNNQTQKKKLCPIISLSK